MLQNPLTGEPPVGWRCRTLGGLDLTIPQGLIRSPRYLGQEWSGGFLSFSTCRTTFPEEEGTESHEIPDDVADNAESHHVPRGGGPGSTNVVCLL